MKKTFILVVLALVSATLLAQTKAQNERIKEIREEMKEAMQRIEDNKDIAEYAENRIQLDMSRNLPGSGMQHYKIDMYISDLGDEEKGEQDWRPFFFRVKYNYAAREIVHECLVNPETKKPIFMFRRMPDDEAVFEDRIYFNANGSFCYASETSLENPDGKKSVRTMKANDQSVKYNISFFNQIIKWAIETQKL